MTVPSGYPPIFRRWLAALGLLAALLLPTDGQAQSRIKDIADFEGIRDNMLVGYGLVVGLNGTGDSLQNSVFTKESLVSMLDRLGVNARDSSLRTKNIAAVMVTATLPPFARQGTRVDIVVSTLGDAANLMGGTLLVTPLVGADAEVYAVAQGTVAVSGFSAQGAGQSVTRGVPTAGRIANGAIVEREIAFQLASLELIRIALRNPDLTTARRIAQAINAFVGVPAARSLDPGTVAMQIPVNYRNDVIGLLTDVEQLRVAPTRSPRWSSTSSPASSSWARTSASPPSPSPRATSPSASPRPRRSPSPRPSRPAARPRWCRARRSTSTPAKARSSA